MSVHVTPEVIESEKKMELQVKEWRAQKAKKDLVMAEIIEVLANHRVALFALEKLFEDIIKKVSSAPVEKLRSGFIDELKTELSTSLNDLSTSELTLHQ